MILAWLGEGLLWVCQPLQVLSWLKEWVTWFSFSMLQVRYCHLVNLEPRLGPNLSLNSVRAWQVICSQMSTSEHGSTKSDEVGGVLCSVYSSRNAGPDNHMVWVRLPDGPGLEPRSARFSLVPTYFHCSWLGDSLMTRILLECRTTLLSE